MNSTRDAPNILESQPIEDIDSFMYDGSVVSRTGESDKESELVKHVRHTTHQGHLEQKKHPYQNQTQLFNCHMKIILLYDLWKQTKNLEHNLYCMSPKNIDHWPERILNQELWRNAKQNPVFITTKKRKSR